MASQSCQISAYNPTTTSANNLTTTTSANNPTETSNNNPTSNSNRTTTTSANNPTKTSNNNPTKSNNRTTIRQHPTKTSNNNNNNKNRTTVRQHPTNDPDFVSEFADRTNIPRPSRRPGIFQAMAPESLGGGLSSISQSVLMASALTVTGETGTTSVDQRIYAYQMVRTDMKERRLDEFTAKTASQSLSQTEMVPVDGIEPQADGEDEVEWREFDFDSLKAMKKDICMNTSIGLRNLFKDHTYIGAAGPTQAVIQHSTNVYLIDSHECFMHFFYQLLVLSFGNFGSFKLSESASLAELILLENKEEKLATVCEYVELLVDNRDMLNDYFCLQISLDGYLETIPSLIEGYIPQLEALPMLISDLAFNVDWGQEKTCFEGICWALAKFFCVHEQYCDGELLSGLDDHSLQWRTVFSDLLYPALKTNFLPPQSLTAKIRRILKQSDLYKVFDRC